MTPPPTLTHVAKPQGRFSKWFERVALGTIMTVVAFVVERRLLKVIRERGAKDGSVEEGEAERASRADLRSPTA